jgi:hypothetical protein
MVGNAEKFFDLISQWKVSTLCSVLVMHGRTRILYTQFFMHFTIHVQSKGGRGLFYEGVQIIHRAGVGLTVSSGIKQHVISSTPTDHDL